MIQKSCFVISAIGEKDSDIRKHANDLYDLILEPALEKYSFKLTRADKIVNTSSITQDIVNLVQNSDLCIIDLTGKNANVMYECGRRHETGKPFIMIAKEGENLPFDITTIRTIFYDINYSRSIREAQLAIQKVIDSLLSEGFSPQSSGESLATISDSLRRIERKIDSFNVNTPVVPKIESDKARELIDDQKLTPYEAYFYTIRNRNYSTAEDVLKILLKDVNDSDSKVIYANYLGSNSDYAIKVIEENILSVKPDYTEFDWNDSILSLVQFLEKNDLPKEFSEFILETIKYFLPHTTNNEQKSALLNLKSRTYYSLGNYEEAINVGLEVLKYWSQNPSYNYNLALNYEAANDIENALKYVTISINNENPSVAALSKAYKLYKKANMDIEAENALSTLKRINPIKAEVLISLN